MADHAGASIGRTTYDVAVVGGGIVGAATAYHLAGLGARTALLERGAFGTEASGRNAGTLNLINDRATRFDGLPLRIASIERWRGLSDELGVDLEVDIGKGTLLVAEQVAELPRLRELAAGHRAHGIEIEWLEGAGLRAFAPYLAHDVAAAIFCPIGGQANPQRAGAAFAAAAERRGATLFGGAEVTAVRPLRGGGCVCDTPAGPVQAACVLVAAGPWSAALLEPLGVTVPIRIRYFQAAATVPVAPFIHHGLRRVAGMLTLKQTKGGACILGGGWTGVSAFPVHGTVSPDALDANRAVASRLVPAFARIAVARSWAGYDGSSLDGQPILDAVPGHPGLFVSTGASTGFSDGPTLGELAAQTLLGLPTGHDVSQFRLSRFDPAPCARVGV